MEIKPNLPLQWFAKYDETTLPVPFTALSSIKTDIFLSLYKGKKNQQDFLIKNETEIH